MIHTVASESIADITVNASAAITAAVFSFDISDLGAVDDLFDLADIFGLSVNLTGLELGLAATASVIGEAPAPATFGLFAIGAAFLGWALQHKTDD